MRRLIYSMLMLSIVAVSCSGGYSPDQVDVLSDNDIIDVGDLTEIACDFKVYPLKSNDPIDGIGGIKFFGNKGFARNSDDNRILCFDENYNLYAVLDRLGNGPGEYHYISDFTYNAKKNILSIPNDTIIWEYDGTTMEYLGKRYVDVYIQNMLNIGDKILYNCYPIEEHRQLLEDNQPGHVTYSVMLADADDNSVAKNGTVFTQHNYLRRYLYGSPQIFYVNPMNKAYSETGYVNRIVTFNDDSVTTVYRFRLEAIDPPSEYIDCDYSQVDDFVEFVIGWYDAMEGKPCPEEIYNIIVDGKTISFAMGYYPYGRFTQHEMLYWVHNGNSTKAYKKLRIPGLLMDIEPTGCHDNRNVAIIENLGEDAIDEFADMSPLAQKIIDALKSQNDENPVLIEFRFK